MKYIKTNSKITLEWQVMKGIGNVEEDFSRSSVSLFLVKDGTENRYTISCTANANGLVRAVINENTLPVGVYGVELLWLKNEGHAGESRCVNRTRKACVFGIDAAVNDTEQPVTVKLKTTAASYGYDGLSSYELAVLKGQTVLSENDYVQNLTDQSELIASKAAQATTYTKAEMDAALAGKADKNGSLQEEFAARVVNTNAVNTGLVYADWIYRGQQGSNGGGILIPTVNQGEQEEMAVKRDFLQYVYGASYDSTTRRINFLNSVGTVLSYIDASAFIKDGMVSSAAVNNGNLVITFNTDAEQSPISIPLTDVFNPANYYTKTEVQGLLDDLAALRPLTVTVTFSPEGRLDGMSKTYDEIDAAFTSNKRVIIDCNCAEWSVRFSADTSRVYMMDNGVAKKVFNAHTFYVDNNQTYHLLLTVSKTAGGDTIAECERI